MADRIIVISGPPGHITQQLTVGLPRPRTSQDVRAHADYPRLSSPTAVLAASDVVLLGQSRLVDAAPITAAVHKPGAWTGDPRWH